MAPSQQTHGKEPRDGKTSTQKQKPGLKAYVKQLAQDEGFDWVIDFVVILNAVFVGLEVDAPDMLGGLSDVLRIVFCVVYILEFAMRLVSDAQHFVTKCHLLKIELLIVLLAIIGAFALPDKKVLWRCSVFRIIRGVRVLPLAHRSTKLADLWLVLVAIIKALKALMFLSVILTMSCIIFGIAARGLVLDGDEDDLTTAFCGADDFRVHMDCIDTDQYFGSVIKSAFTMLQVATLDRWAAHVVRPLASIRPLSAAFIVCFVCMMFYGLLSIAVGVLVWATIELATQHDNHRTRAAIVQDRERIHHIRDYFDKCLQVEEREMLDFREIKEAMLVPPVKKAYEELDLPVTDLDQLWCHLDPHDEGEITLDDFEQGCKILLEPTKRFDMACLSAQLNGRAVFVDRLVGRCDDTIADMDDLFQKLTLGFAKMRKHVLSPDINETFPEVGLRREGKMAIPHLEDDE